MPSKKSSKKKPCKEGQRRSRSNGRCHSIKKKSSKKPCKEGQRRSRSNGRCHSIKKKSSKKPCKEGQRRSRSNGHCRSIKKKSSRKKCGEGQRRNRSNGRCYSIKKSKLSKKSSLRQNQNLRDSLSESLRRNSLPESRQFSTRTRESGENLHDFMDSNQYDDLPSDLERYRLGREEIDRQIARDRNSLPESRQFSTRTRESGENLHDFMDSNQYDDLPSDLERYRLGREEIDRQIARDRNLI